MNSWPELDRRCTALNRSGERCGRAPIPGGRVCLLHGGAAPQAQAAAKTRLLAMVEPVLGVFESIVETWHSTRCEKCGKPTGDPMPVIRVGQLVLDRAGFHPSLTIHAAPPAVETHSMTDDELLDKLNATIPRLIETRDQLLRAREFERYEGEDGDAARQLPEATEGFIVPEDDEPDLDGAIPLGDLDTRKVDDPVND